MWRKLVCAGGILLLLFAVATSVFNLVAIHELTGLAGNDIGTNKGNINLLVVENVVMREQIGKNLETMAKISVILDAMSITIIHNTMDTIDLEKDLDKLNAVVQANEYHHEFEYKKKIAENREKLIAEGIWKKNERQ
jgi:hypothetical protein